MVGDIISESWAASSGISSNKGWVAKNPHEVKRIAALKLN
jgi:hypothetical protein